MADWNNPDVWRQAYHKQGLRPNKEDSVLPTGAGYGEDLTYLDGRKYALQRSDDGLPGLSHYRRRLSELTKHNSFTPAADTLIIGCGFGWLIEVAVDLGSNSVWGTDTSTLIQSLILDPTKNIRSDIQPLILNVDFTAPDAADQFKALGAGSNKGQFTNVVTEHVLEDWPIASINVALDACDALLGPGQTNVFHIVTGQDKVQGDSDPVLVPNQFTLAEWVALRPAHIWIDEVTGNIGGGV